MREIFKSDNITLFYDEKIKCIVYRIGRLPSSSEKVREAGKSLVKACQRYPASSVIVDARGSLGVLYEDVEWSSLHITPRIIQAGVKKVAIIHEDNETLNVSIQEHMELSKHAPITQQLFTSEDEAKKWLSEELF